MPDSLSAATRTVDDIHEVASRYRQQPCTFDRIGRMMEQELVADILQLVVGLGLLNVWIVRSRSATAYRGGDATTLRAEFAAYGLPAAAFLVVGGLKIGSALVLIAGVWFALPVAVAAGIVAVLMAGAIAMHVKVRDPAIKALPASLMLVMSTAIALLTA